MLVAGRNTGGEWVLNRAGARNLATHEGYKPISVEALAALDPVAVVIADRSLEGDAARAALLKQNPASPRLARRVTDVCWCLTRRSWWAASVRACRMAWRLSPQPLSFRETAEYGSRPLKSVVRPRALFGALGISLVLVLWLSLALGPVSLPLGDTLRAALRLAGLPLDGTGLAQAEMILGQIRLPRTLLGLAVGAVLALSGVAMQGLFRNPLADPGLVGVSSGAALGAALAIVFGASLGGLPAFLAPYLLSLCAFGGGLG